MFFLHGIVLIEEWMVESKHSCSKPYRWSTFHYAFGVEYDGLEISSCFHALCAFGAVEWPIVAHHWTSVFKFNSSWNWPTEKQCFGRAISFWDSLRFCPIPTWWFTFWMAQDRDFLEVFAGHGAVTAALRAVAWRIVRISSRWKNQKCWSKSKKGFFPWKLLSARLFFLL